MMENQPPVMKTGTSTIGITFNGGVVVGADHRATMGHFIANKSVQKLFKIGDNLALTTAGLVGHAQSLSRTLAAEVSLFQLRRQQPMTVKGAATLTANILSGRPHWVQLLIVGVDAKVVTCTPSTPLVDRFLTPTAPLVQDLLTCMVSLKTASAKVCLEPMH